VDAAASLIERLALKPHPEGGWYREVHRAAERVDTARGPRSALTTIYYLLEQGQLSRWHVVESDEVWHFYGGAPLELLAYDPSARTLRRSVLAPPATVGSEPIGVIEAGVWQAARSLGSYSLVGCNVGPGFEFTDFRFVTAVPGHAAHFTGELARYAGLL
jgi:predicted cupin superfamily sugar epimerase